MEQEGTLVRSIYYGRIGSKATERLLERFGRDGSFLLRDSETVRGAYCLCVRKAPYVHTYRLVHSAGHWQMQVSGVTSQRFRTVEALIENYRRAQVAAMPSLTDPLDKTQLPNNMGEGLWPCFPPNVWFKKKRDFRVLNPGGGLSQSGNPLAVTLDQSGQ